MITVNTTIAFCDEKVDIYIAKNLIPSHQNLDEDEEIELGAYTIEELQEQILSGKITDGKTIAALMSYARKYNA